MKDIVHQRLGFTLPDRHQRASKRRRLMIVQASAVAALIVSLAVAAVVVSIGIARADGRAGLRLSPCAERMTVLSVSRCAPIE